MTTSGTKDTSRLFDALSHRYRRVVLYYLREHETAALDGLVDLVTGWVEAGPGPDESVDRDGVRAELHHVHLPTLESAELVEYDRDARSVAAADRSEAADVIIDAALKADTTGARLNVEGVLAAAEAHTETRSPGEAACGPGDDADRDDPPGRGTEEGDDG